MSIFKERADLKNQSLRALISEMETKRDSLLDELANRKGQVETTEALIKRLYELILDNNKEEQRFEAEHLSRAVAEKAKEAAAELRQQELEVFERAKKGIKTPKKSRA